MTGGLHPDVLALAAIGLWPARRPTIVLMGEMWQPDPGLRGLIQRTLVRLADRAVRLYAVFSHDERELFPANWGVDPAKIRIVHYFASIREADLDGPVCSEGFVFSGGTSMRDYEPLLAAARELPDVRFVLATDQLEGRHDLPPNVQAGRVSHREFMNLLRKASVVVVPLRGGLRRGAGQQTYLNAMWLGKPVVVSRAPAVVDHIDDGRTGVVVDGSPASYAEAIRDLLDDPDTARAIGAAAAREVRGRFTYRRHIDGMLDVLDEALLLDGRAA